MKDIKKYSLSTETKTMHGIVGGYTDYATIKELLTAYMSAKNGTATIRNVGLSYDYINSLYYKEREQIVVRDLQEVLNVAIDHGIKDFEIKYGRLFFKCAK